MTYRRLLIVMAALAMTVPVSFSSSGHQMVEDEWCMGPHEHPEVIESFNFNEKDLGNVMLGCGIVLNPRNNWQSISTAIGIYCDNLARGYNARAIITGPKSFLSRNHHETYRISDGLVGGCAVCIPTEP